MEFIFSHLNFLAMPANSSLSSKHDGILSFKALLLKLYFYDFEEVLFSILNTCSLYGLSSLLHTLGVVTPSPGSQISPRMRKWEEKKGANGESLHMEDV